MDLTQYIRVVPDFPKPGILFRDITPLLGDPRAFREAIRQLAEHYRDKKIDVVAAAEARGFIFAAPLALELDVGFVPVRKPGKLPFDTHVVRTFPETFLIVLTPEGAVSATYVLAFYEPLEYLPAERWLRQFDGKRASDDLRIGPGIAGITGSTLTSHAVAGGLRRALAIYAVLLGDR